MKIGTKSVLFGAHCFFIHPIFVMISWWKLYGFPWDPRLWVAFFVHDLGYWGKPNMDGEEGETHVELGAKIMGWLFDRGSLTITVTRHILYRKPNGTVMARGEDHYYRIIRSNDCYWENFSRYHSRFYAKKDKEQYSKLCVADKLAICIEPMWLYLLRVNMTGEINEYMAKASDKKGKNASMNLKTKNQKEWFISMGIYLRKWVYEHKDLKPDTWTPEYKESINNQGVWK